MLIWCYTDTIVLLAILQSYEMILKLNTFLDYGLATRSSQTQGLSKYAPASRD